MAGRSNRARLLTLLAALVAVAWPGVAQAKPTYGVAVLNQPPAAEYSRMGSGGVDVVRIVMSWPDIQPTADGGYDWSNFDSIVADAAASGVEVLPILYGSPPWAVDCGNFSPSDCRRIPPLESASARRAWARFLRAAVNRYGRDGEFWRAVGALAGGPSLPVDAPTPTGNALPYHPIRRWQVWNEPSSPTYWKPKPNHKDFAKLIEISAGAIRGADSKADVLLAGLFGTPFGGQDPSLLAWRFLNRFYRVKGIERDFDAVALHPYAPTLRGVRYQIDQVRKVMKRHGDKRTPTWITEIGWGSAESAGEPLLKGEQGQKEMLRRAFKLLNRVRDWRVRGIVWFSWRDPGDFVEGCTSPFCLSSGLLDENGNPKPSWNAYTSFTGGTP
jgi:hypothetical protein